MNKVKNKINIVTFLLFILVFIFCIPSSFAAVYHVTTTGDNGNGGTNSTTDAWATPKYGCAQLDAGDTLYIHEGTYTGSAVRSITFSNSGTESNPIVVSGVPGESRPILDAQVSQLSSDTICIFSTDGCNWLTIKSLDLKNAGGNGGASGCISIDYNVSSDNITVENCKMGSFARGGNTWGQNNPAAVWIRGGKGPYTFKKCEFYNDEVGQGSGIKIKDVENILIENCEFHHLADGISNKYGIASSTNHIYRNNFFYDLGDTPRGAIWCSSPEAKISNNLIIGAGVGIELANWNPWHACIDATVDHNTIYQVDSHGVWLHTSTGSMTGITLTNNVIVNAGGTHELRVAPYGYADFTTSDYNCFYNSGDTDVIADFVSWDYTLAEWQTAYPSRDAHSVQELPTFANGSGTMTKITDFEITGGNANNGAEDSTDMGANVFLVGLSAKSVALTGTLADGATEAQVVAGGETLIGIITNDTLVATFGADNAITTAFIAALDSGGTEAAGWDAEVRGDGTNKLTHAEVVRTNDTTFTITLTAKAAYAITTNETITCTVPATSLTGGVAIVATPTFEITASNPACTMTGTLSDGATEAQIVTGSQTLIGTVSDTELVATFGENNAITTAFIALIDSAQAEAGGWDAQVKANITHANISRDSAIQWTLTTPAATGFDISANEIITVKLPTTATTSGVEITCTPTVAIIFFEHSTEESKGFYGEGITIQ